jgi:hypothetical protein
VLELRPGCEQCDRDLPPDSPDAMICTFECTFCITCVQTVLQNVCPNCGGELVRRPVRPKDKLLANPPAAKRIFHPMAGERLARHAANVLRYHAIDPQKR